jgi:hypothetical protein
VLLQAAFAAAENTRQQARIAAFRIAVPFRRKRAKYAETAWTAKVVLGPDLMTSSSISIWGLGPLKFDSTHQGRQRRQDSAFEQLWSIASRSCLGHELLTP